MMWATSSGLNTDSTSDKNTFTNTLISKARITKDIQEAINKQINAELWSAYLYLSMSMDAENKSLKGVANWFYVQWLEEQDHAHIFMNYLNDQNASVHLEPISAVPTGWKSVLDMFRDTLDHEQEVTALIHDLVLVAMDEHDFATISRLQWFVDEQVEEESSAQYIIDMIKRTNGDPLAIDKLDHELSHRAYQPASPLG